MRMYSVKVWAQGERTGGQPISSLALVTVEAEDAEAACVLAVDYADKMAPMTDVRWKSFEWLEATSEAYPQIEWGPLVKRRRPKRSQSTSNCGAEPK